MSDIVWGLERLYHNMAKSQDAIGWRRFMEGMVALEMQQIQDTHSTVKGSVVSLVSRTTGLVIKLLEINHGQWLYRCVQVHDRVKGMQETTRKEELQREIEKQRDQGWGDLLEEDSLKY